MRRKRASDRVLRLYMAAFWSWQSHRLTTPQERNKLKRRAAWVEGWADSGVKPKEAVERSTFVFYNDDAKRGFTSTVRAPGGWNKGGPAVERAVWALREVFGNPFATRRKRKTDPRRGSMFVSAWRTNTVLTLARQMYESRDFGAMPILADALQEVPSARREGVAGCDNDANPLPPRGGNLLIHCRESREHVRGCWVLDLVLDKA